MNYWILTLKSQTKGRLEVTFKTTVKDNKGNPVPNAVVLAADLFLGLTFSRGTDGSGYADVALFNIPIGRQMMLSVQSPGYENFIIYPTTTESDQIVNVVLVSFLNPLWRPTEEEIRRFRGAFVVPGVLPEIPYGDNERIWSPGFLLYDENWQDEIIRIYHQFDYNHMPINLGGTVYHNDYPELPDDPLTARRGIVKLLNNRIIPICCATNDAVPDVVLNSYKKNADIIDCSFVMWEMNGPCHNDSDRMFRITSLVREAAPKALTYLHFTAGHGSMGEPEGEWWKKCAAIGIKGLFSQDDHWDNPILTASGLEDTAKHLHGHVAGWEGLDLDNVGFEQTTTPVYHKYPGWDLTKQRTFGKFLLDNCPNIAGVVDGF